MNDEKLQAPSTKLQRSPKLQSSKTVRAMSLEFGVWSLGFLWCLDVGAWSFMSEPLLSAKAVHKTYILGKRSLEVLRGVDVELQRGDFLALRGASGAGKSTLLHLLGGLDSPNEGEIWLAGRNLATLSRGELASLRNGEVGFIFQAYYLLPEL